MNRSSPRRYPAWDCRIPDRICRWPLSRSCRSSFLLLMVQELRGVSPKAPDLYDAFAVTMGDGARIEGIKLVEELRARERAPEAGTAVIPEEDA